ncbi:MAG: hypothetical protein J6U60_03140 [Clostridia bacterium]|nr:hypothetical protein [Clostridia bacterium]
MSTTNTESIVYDVTPAEVSPEVLPELTAEATAPETEQPTPKKKNVFARIIAALFVALAIAVVFLPIKIMKGANVESLSLLSAVKDLFGGEQEKLFGVLPTYADTATNLGKFVGVSLYAFVGLLVLSVVFGVIAIFNGKKAPALLRVCSFFFTLGFTMQAVATIVAAYKADASVVIDVVVLGLLALGLLVYFVLAAAKLGKTAWANLLQFILTAVVLASVALYLIKDAEGFKKGLEGISLASSCGMITLAIFAVLGLNLFLSLIRIQTKKGLVFDLIRFIVQFVIGVAVCYLVIASKSEEKLALVLAIVAAAVSLLQVVICIIRTKLASPKKEKPVVEEEPVVLPEPPVEEFVREEYAEALPYEGGPVEGVAVAEEVNPTFIPEEPPQVQTAGYDFYNCKSFDPFIATLDTVQRNQFTEIFILKYNGAMPEIPDYEVGGDNKEFFRKLFIYLGQYRDRIPDALLAKIYQFAIKMN